MADALFFGAHPDDVEILAGGMVASMTAAGRKVHIADATRGEMGTRGTPEERAAEAAEAAQILGVAGRHNLELPDGRIGEDQPAAIRAAVRLIRQVRPRLVFVHEPGDHHPDHHALSQAVKFACFQSFVAKYGTGQDRFRPSRLFYYVGSRIKWPEQPSFIADVTAHFPRKLEALRAYRSQFHNPEYKGEETFISSELGWQMIEVRSAFFGQLIGVKFGEAFVANEPLRIDDPMGLAGET